MEIEEIHRIFEIIEDFGSTPTRAEVEALIVLLKKAGSTFDAEIKCLDLSERISAIPIDRKGHSDDLNCGVYKSLLSSRLSLAPSLLAYLEGKAPSEAITLLKDGYCDNCGDRVSFSFSNGQLTSLTTCEFSDGVIADFDLHVPSGIISMTDNLCGAYTDLRTVSRSRPNTRKWLNEIARFFEKLGLIHLFVGQTFPYFVQTSADTYSLMVIPEESDLPAGLTKLAQINTELWWVSICDFGDLQKRDVLKSPSTVTVSPGTYRFTHLIHEPSAFQAGTLVTVKKL